MRQVAVVGLDVLNGIHLLGYLTLEREGTRNRVTQTSPEVVQRFAAFKRNQATT